MNVMVNLSNIISAIHKFKLELKIILVQMDSKDQIKQQRFKCPNKTEEI